MNRPLGQVLIEARLITAEQRDQALASQQGQNDQAVRERIGTRLIQMKALTEEGLSQGLALQWEMPWLPTLDTAAVDAALSKKVPIAFAKRHRMLPIRQIGRVVQVAAADPLDLTGLDDLAILLAAPVSVVVAPPRAIAHQIQSAYERAAQPEEAIADLSDLAEAGSLKTAAEAWIEPEDLLSTDDQAPVIRLVNSILFQAVMQRASDIHFEPFEQEVVVRYRIDGILHNILTVPKRLQAALASRVKIMAGMNIAEKRLPQDGRVALRIGSREIDVRVADVPIAHGERLVLRLLDKSNPLLHLSAVGFSPAGLATFSQLIQMAHGMVLVTGPTGSGKTTTLYAALNRINAADKNIITIEDPVEYQLKGVGQIQVNPKIDLTFGNGLRSILRQDPDVIMVGEIRDRETAEIAIHASLTGHLFLSTLHTNDAAGAIARLLDMGIEPFLVASSVVAIVAQRLVRRICPACTAPYSPSVAEREKLGVALSDATPFQRGAGCAECLNTGYHGRVALYEILTLDDALRSLILAQADAAQIRTAAIARGMIPLRADGARRVVDGVTTTEEVLRVTQGDLS